MTAGTRRLPPGRYRFRHVARMEWVKLASLRSTWATLGITIAAAAGIAVLAAAGTKTPSQDLTNSIMTGMFAGVLLAGVLGVLAVTSEYTCETIRATLAAAPRRPLVLAAKAAVFGVTTLITGQAAAFLAFFAGRTALGHGIAAPALGQPGVLRTIVLSGASLALIGLLGLAWERSSGTPPPRSRCWSASCMPASCSSGSSTARSTPTCRPTSSATRWAATPAAPARQPAPCRPGRA